MKRFIAIMIASLMAALCMAETTLTQLNTSKPSMTTTNSLSNKKTAWGQVARITIACETNVTVTITALKGYGASLNADRVIFAELAITSPGYSTNLTSGAILANDKLVLKTKSSSTNQTVRAGIVTTQ